MCLLMMTSSSWPSLLPLEPFPYHAVAYYSPFLDFSFLEITDIFGFGDPANFSCAVNMDWSPFLKIHGSLLMNRP